MKKDDYKYNFIKLFFVMMAMVMMFSIDVEAAKLNKTSITLVKGKTYTLKMKGTKKKVTWKTKNKKVAKLSSKKRSSVKIKAVKVGKTYVIGKIGKKSYKCKVTVVKAKKSDSVTSAEEQVTDGTTEETTETTTEASVTTTETEQKTEKYKVWIMTKFGVHGYTPVYVNMRSEIECTACGYKTENKDEASAHQYNHLLNAEKNGYRSNTIWDDVYWEEYYCPEEGYWIEVDVGTYPEGLRWMDKEDAVQRLMKDTTTGQEFTPTEGYYYINKANK